jgi:hypothetical protein
MPFIPLDPIVSHWHQSMAGVDFSPRTFYAAVEELVDKLAIPGVRRSRIHWPEHGALSSVREYLRFERLGYRFDVCAAPFGKGFFVSWWLVRPLPTWYGVLGWHLASLLILVGSFFLAQLVGLTTVSVSDLFRTHTVGPDQMASAKTLFAATTLYALLSVAAPPVILLFVYHVCIRLGLATVQTIRAILVFGPLYMRLFNPLTYYVMDTAQMFQDAIAGAVSTALDQMTEGKGMRAIPELPPAYDLLQY